MTTTRRTIARWIPLVVLWVGLSQILFGCGDRVRLPSPERLAAFENAGPTGPVVDMNEVVQATLPKGPYRVQVGDVLELQLPVLLYPDVQPVQPGAVDRNAHVSRVSDRGTVTLPDGREIEAVGKTLAQIEADVVNAYYPELVKTRPSVYTRVIEYARLRVRIMGAVTNPGLYELRHDQMSLVGLLMQAGGIVGEGAAVIRVTHSRQADGQPTIAPYPMSSPPVEVSRQQSVARSGRSSTSARRHSDAPAAYIRFQREGPLDTTGWLSVTYAGETAFRKWLDIGSSRQRWEALGKVDAAVPVRGLAEMDAKLSGLARFLTTGPRSSNVHLAAYEARRNWSRGDGNVFVASVDVAEAPSEDTPEESPVDLEPPHARVSAGSETTVILPVKGMNIPFADVALGEGDSVVVERLTMQTISILGLVNGPGSFPYPPGTTYNLGEALALAGGLDFVARPRYVSVYRPKADGTVASATFQFVKPKRQEQLTEALTVKVKPGDIISVEHTPRTRTNVFFDRIVRISLGWYFNPDQFWGDND